MTPIPSSKPAIEAINIRRVYRSPKREEGMKGFLKLLMKPEVTEHEALKGVSFSVAPGEFIGLIGENGAGKTTLLKILSGLIPPTTGDARVLDFEPFKRTTEFRRQISLVMGQKAQLWWDLPAIDAFDLLRAVYQIPRDQYKKRLDALAAILHVEKHLQTQIRRLSLGERMKMELIGALIHFPKVIFLDEPTIGLDVLAAYHLRQFLAEHNKQEGATTILTSHNMEDISQLCKRVLILQNGVMVFDGQPEKLLTGEERRLKTTLKTATTIPELSKLTQVAETSITAGEAGVYTFSVAKNLIPRVLQSLMPLDVVDMGIEEPSLEGVIQRIYQDNRVGVKNEALR
jgi:ABC-2 type transport system ATP-binding protein